MEGQYSQLARGATNASADEDEEEDADDVPPLGF